MSGLMDATTAAHLVAAVAARDAADREVARWVGTARERGYTWQEIGKGLGVTKQAAQQRYGRMGK